MVCLLGLVMIGCSWQEVEQNAEKVHNVTEKGSEVATVLAPFTAGYGTAAAGILSGLGNVALAIAALAKSKKAKAIAKAAVEASDMTEGGGIEMVKAAQDNGVSNEIKTAYDKHLEI